MKFKVGEKVKIKDNITDTHGISINYIEKFKNEFNQFTISRCRREQGINYYQLEEDRNLFRLYFGEDMLETAEEHKNKYTYEDLKKSPIGTKITFETGAVLVKDEENYFENVSKSRDIDNLYNLKDNYSDLGKIIKIEEPEYKTVYESKKEILDEVEKRYLRGVIRPYKTVKNIYKTTYDGGKKSIVIITVIDIDGDKWEIQLPPFETEDMYKEMEVDKKYTLEELGL